MPNTANFFSHVLKLGLLLLCASAYLSVTGCVTTTTGGFNVEASDEKEIERRVQLASNYLRNGNVDAAKKHLKRALEIDTKSAEVHNTLGLVHIYPNSQRHWLDFRTKYPSQRFLTDP